MIITHLKKTQHIVTNLKGAYIMITTNLKGTLSLL